MPSEREVEALWEALGGPPGPFDISQDISRDDLARALSAAEGVRKGEGAADLAAEVTELAAIEDALRERLAVANENERLLGEENTVLEGELASLRALLAEAGEGLGPFKRAIEMAEGAFVHAEIGPTTSVLTAIATSYLHIEDFRRARALLAKIEKMPARPYVNTDANISIPTLATLVLHSWRRDTEGVPFVWPDFLNVRVRATTQRR
jgi:hypothetical protein